MLHQLETLLHRPALYEAGTARLWEDEHISKGMLEAHLDADWDAATRNHAFVRESVAWIAQTAPPGEYPALLDLGCGPGVYAELFHQAGYRVTGVDLSPRSIRYARDSAREKHLPIEYRVCDYLRPDERERFDLVTLIYCDFGVLSPEDRARLLGNIRAALKPGGLLILDVFTPAQYEGRRQEHTGWEYAAKGFFCPRPHLHLEAFYCYEEEATFCKQHILVEENGAKSVNIWEHVFTKGELEAELARAGFSTRGIYASVSGAAFTQASTVMCVVAKKAAQ